MAKADYSDAPYQDIFGEIVRSIMRAQSEVLKVAGPKISLSEVPHASINRHFVWLTRYFKEGLNRHLFEGANGNSPLRTYALRAAARIPDNLRTLIDGKDSIPLDADEQKHEKRLVQTRPTRISSIIFQSFAEVPRDEDAEDEKRSQESEQVIRLKSPLAIAFDFLTAPNMPGSRAYVLLTLRNYLFETFNRFPRDLAPLPNDVTFSVSDVEEALSHIQTSVRARYWSSGEDKLPAEGRSIAGGLLRQFLAAKGMLWLRFTSLRSCFGFLEGERVVPADRSSDGAGVFEFSKCEYLDHLPELAELINELWGIPIPIRGADTLFRGGLKLASRGGLVVGLHGGPGVGKTSLALALGASLSPFEIKTLFLTGEEGTQDLQAKIEAILPDDLRRRLSIFPTKTEDWLSIEHFEIAEDISRSLELALKSLAKSLRESHPDPADLIASPKPCRAVVVLDGLHDLLMSFGRENINGAPHSLMARLREFIVTCRQLQALVILTTGEEWFGDKALDYLVDVALRLSHNGLLEPGKKPDRRILVSKARYQLCAVGTHGIQIAGAKGLRFSPQINYQLDKLAVWKTRLPQADTVKRVFSQVLSETDYVRFARDGNRASLEPKFHPARGMVKLPKGSNIFLNGEGSGGKAALALKIALSPSYLNDEKLISERERVLVVSFLYPLEYYEAITAKLLRLRRLEYQVPVRELRPYLNVMHLYPGNYQPDHLFNRIAWELDSGELHGQPYSAVIVDGIHNVFLQFPEIERYNLFWPQLYSALRARAITIISTHTTFVMPGLSQSPEFRLDDRRSEPLRHALVQKTDFRFEIDPVDPEEFERTGGTSRDGLANIFSVRTLSAINQPIPDHYIYWSRENLVLFESDQGELPFLKRRQGRYSQ